METSRRAVVVVPTYNEAGNIERLLETILASDPNIGVLVVDDSSPDGTADIVDRVAARSEFARRVDVLRRPSKSGLGTAYRAGFSRVLDAGDTICVQMDADFSHDPRYLIEIISAVEMGADAAIGSRYVPGGRIENWPRLRLFLSRWGNRYAAGMLGLAVNDATAGYRAYSPALLRRIDFASVRAEGYGFQIEMTHRAVRSGARIVEVPITFVDRVVGESKLSHHIINEAFGLVNRLWFRDRLLRRRR
ncbi:MAG: polyprenol monophosphomannose synthase [Acidimicrobiia bacterium]|nr:polyprenol monophosphomannose synthase [Actinomycetota bacterium]NDB04889.1 polyprenol monophosphomannose synthase [Acidimicrobiia bacterium]NDA77092.1 polyprenol monophosphomannose synthase [Actinomycetota bacterium]NDD96469.1 polyprenol monophosphomannose synthase [Actinomycetota bacterium]NDE57942.1 polyprenol monophosphomannose synthase [Acidimicrobiia bacterium]